MYWEYKGFVLPAGQTEENAMSFIKKRRFGLENAQN